MNEIKSRKSQEEIIGFVLIVVLVTIIALVFLVINIRQAPQEFESSEIESFLQAGMKYSSDCYQSPEIRYDLKDLIKACYDGRECLDGKDACIELNKTLSSLLEESWKPGPDNPIKAYNFQAYDTTINNKTVIIVKEGLCSGQRAGSWIRVSSEIRADFEICY